MDRRKLRKQRHNKLGNGKRKEGGIFRVNWFEDYRL